MSQKYSNKWYEEQKQLYRDMFYEFSGIPEDKELTENDIRENYLGAFNKICLQTGCNESFLKNSLLNK